MIRFLKMHGLGNDFAVFDARKQALALDAPLAHALADRRRGIGCDQVIVIERAVNADAAMRIRNADGGEVEACGNAARCVARLLMDETDSSSVRIETLGGVLTCKDAGGGLVTVDMGKPEFDWEKIPLSRRVSTEDFPLEVEGKSFSATAVSMGNPHCVLFVDDAETAPVTNLGPRIETMPLFPNRTNVAFVTVRDAGHLRMRVWERGAGVTQACGSGACAAAAAAYRRGITGNKVKVQLDGGTLTLELLQGHAFMTGPAALTYRGEIDFAVFDA